MQICAASMENGVDGPQKNKKWNCLMTQRNCVHSTRLPIPSDPQLMETCMLPSVSMNLPLLVPYMINTLIYIDKNAERTIALIFS